MNPTLCAQDFLEVRPYAGRSVRPGDVIAFAQPDGDILIAHRVVAVTPGGIKTKGDNNRGEDKALVQMGDVLGQVTAAWRGDRRRRIAGGPAGLWLARLLRLRKLVDRIVSPLLHALYHAMARSGVVRRLWPAHPAPRVVTFQVDGRMQTRLLLGRRTIGWYANQRGEWHIRRPYRLIVDVDRLPGWESSQDPKCPAATRGVNCT
jgi:hypothetical protein